MNNRKAVAYLILEKRYQHLFYKLSDFDLPNDINFDIIKKVFSKINIHGVDVPKNILEDIFNLNLTDKQRKEIIQKTKEIDEKLLEQLKYDVKHKIYTYCYMPELIKSKIFDYKEIKDKEKTEVEEYLKERNEKLTELFYGKKKEK